MKVRCIASSEIKKKDMTFFANCWIVRNSKYNQKKKGHTVGYKL